MAGPIDISVLIATYDRPASLEKTIASVLAQTNTLELNFEVVVVDNHPSQSAKPVVEALASSAKAPIRHVSELTRNMSALRNRAFDEARGPLAAIIDDDELAAPDWLDELVGALRATNADIAVGPRLAVFASGHAPAYDPSGAQFIRDLHLADRSLINLTNPSGKPRYGLGTGNSLFDLRSCFETGQAPMRPEFGDAGGEDAELFVRLHRAGRKIVWAKNAKVTETVAEQRTTIAYRLLRTRRETQHYVSIYLDGAKNRPLAWSILMAKGLLQTFVGALLAGLTGEYRSETRIRGRLLMAHGLGKLTWRRSVGYIYQTVDGRKTLT